ncbi:hypothetical protein FDP41_011775 [Naegleria fowleri]|uniref:Uncharacterized protein n=1 Tax=Naegleria fowleri TaxID=5763 RepID=A0A6A5C609_NAEFO|nr:uncharacterized protein FDP41_011775 [Naegleria fowleri]KAF0981914.1 hypothetical protein FDP41_011775 [Naegleria fowleri]
MSQISNEQGSSSLEKKRLLSSTPSCTDETGKSKKKKHSSKTEKEALQAEHYNSVKQILELLHSKKNQLEGEPSSTHKNQKNWRMDCMVWDKSEPLITSQNFINSNTNQLVMPSVENDLFSNDTSPACNMDSLNSSTHQKDPLSRNVMPQKEIVVPIFSTQKDPVEKSSQPMQSQPIQSPLVKSQPFQSQPMQCHPLTSSSFERDPFNFSQKDNMIPLSGTTQSQLSISANNVQDDI